MNCVICYHPVLQLVHMIIIIGPTALHHFITQSTMVYMALTLLDPSTKVNNFLKAMVL